MARTTKTKPQARQDGWQNLITALGTTSDKRLGHTATVDNLTYADCETLWRGSDIGARIVERPVDEMLRQGYDVTIPSAKGRQEEIQALLEDLGANERIRDGLNYRRAYGGGAVLVGADDGATDLSKPLGRVRKLTYLVSLTPQEIAAATYYDDPRESHYGQPKTYQISSRGSTFQIHESRLLIFQGAVTSRAMLQTSNGWGDSVFVRIRDSLRDFDVVWASAAALMNDFAGAVYKIKGLAEILGSDSESLLVTRIRAIELMRSTIRGVIIDSEEDFGRQQTPIAGLPEILEKFMFRIAAASDMPTAMLFGQAPAGLNATGDSDIRFYYDHLKNQQDRVLRPQLEKLLKMAFQVVGREPRRWNLQFRSLWQLTDSEKAKTHLDQANADAIYLDRQVVTPADVRQSRFGDAYSVETTLQAPAPEAPATTPNQPTIPPNGGQKPSGNAVKTTT